MKEIERHKLFPPPNVIACSLVNYVLLRVNKTGTAKVMASLRQPSSVFLQCGHFIGDTAPLGLWVVVVFVIVVVVIALLLLLLLLLLI